MKIIVTGGAGFIGSCFVRFSLQAEPDFEIVNLDKLTYAGNLENLAPVASDPRYRFVKGDICDGELVRELFEEFKPEAVVHFAAESHVDRSIFAPQPVFDTNLRGSFTLLEAIRARKVSRFVHVSTDEVYGSLEEPLEADESFPLQPSSPYSAAKAGSDMMALAYHKTYKLPILVTRASNNYGPYHFPEKLIPLLIVNILHGRSLPIYGDGRNVRDWLHVSDHCRGIDLILAGGRPGETYNIGGGSESENIQLVHLLCSLADEAFQGDTGLCVRYPQSPCARGERAATLIKFVQDRPGHDRRYAIDCGKLERELGYVARSSLQSGLRATLDWYLQNESWWRGVMDGSYQKWIKTNYHDQRGAD